MQCYLVLHRCFSRRGFWEDLCYAVVSHRTNRYRRFRESLAFHTHALLARTTTKERERERQRYRPFLFCFFLSFWFHPAHIPQWANAFWCRQIGEHIKIHSTRRSLYWCRLNTIKIPPQALLCINWSWWYAGDFPYHVFQLCCWHLANHWAASWPFTENHIWRPTWGVACI